MLKTNDEAPMFGAMTDCASLVFQNDNGLVTMQELSESDPDVIVMMVDRPGQQYFETVEEAVPVVLPSYVQGRYAEFFLGPAVLTMTPATF